MIIDYLNVVGVALAPTKANSPLVVDANAVLAFSVAFQRFEPISRQRGKREQVRRRIQHVELSLRRTFNRLEAANRFTTKEAFGIGAPE